MRAIHELWERLHAFASETPKPLRVRGPASEAAIRAAETTIGIDFPEDFRASLLVHDGQEPGDGDDDAFEWLPGHARLASLDRIVDAWRRDKETFVTHHSDEPATPIEGDKLVHYLWHPRRVPIAGNPWFDQDNTYLDFVPGPRGKQGQLVMFGKGVFGAWHGPSFGEALALYVRGLEKGEWLYRDGQCLPRAKKMTWLKYVAKHFG